jgi:glycosyltransferase involved in cell wall biosynthesis
MIVAYNALGVRPGVADGGATFSLNVLRHLPGELSDSRLVIYAQPGESRLPVPDGRVEIRRPPAGGRGGAAARLAAEAVWLGRDLRRTGASVLVAPTESLPAATPCPVVVIAQNLVYHRADERAFLGASPQLRLRARLQAAYYRRRMRTAYAQAAAVVAVSSETARVLELRAGLDPAKVTIALEGADSFLLPEPETAGARCPSRLLAVATNAPYKNLDRTIEALQGARAANPELTLEVIGSDWHGYRSRLVEHARACEVAAQVTFRNPVSPRELVELYATSGALVFLSGCESFGLPLAEAMRFGLPVVAANRSSIPEVVGDAALLVDPDDVPATTAAIRRVTGDEDLRASLAEKGRWRAAQLRWRDTASNLASVVSLAAAPAK